MTMPLDDRGLLLGDGLFETILAIDGDLVLFDRHIERLRAGCAYLDLPRPDAEATRKLCELALGDTGMTSGRVAVRLTLTAGSGGRGLDRPEATEPHVFATVSRAPRPEGSIGLWTATVRRNQHSPTSRLKTLSYLDNVLARREAAPSEALMLNTDGVVACAAAANVFWITDGRLFTPALDCGVLDGVMRREVLNRAAAFGLSVREGHFPPTAIAEAEAVFITNSLVGVRRVHWFDGSDMPGLPLVQELGDTIARELGDLSSTS
ncbi:MAG TPA: aminotransferase class IV [Caulobacter sp.]|nr:aminotransferase class IV [Caulobacter sp.]